MLTTDGYLKLAASNFRQAESHLKDTETHLLKLLDRLEKCSCRVPVSEVRRDLMWEQINTLVGDSQPLTS